MAVASGPAEINERWAAALTAGDVPAMLDLYEADAVLVPAPGADPVVGHDAIRAALTQLVGMTESVSFTPRYWLRYGDIAMGSIAFRFKLVGSVTPGLPGEMTGATTEVARRQPDGSWKYLIDHPFGAQG